MSRGVWEGCEGSPERHTDFTIHTPRTMSPAQKASIITGPKTQPPQPPPQGPPIISVALLQVFHQLIIALGEGGLEAHEGGDGIPLEPAPVPGLQAVDGSLHLGEGDGEGHLVVLGQAEDAVPIAGQDDMALVIQDGLGDDIGAVHPPGSGGEEAAPPAVEAALDQRHHLGGGAAYPNKMWL